MSAGAARYARIDVAGLNNKILIILMNCAFLGQEKTGPDLYTAGSEHTGRRDSASVADTACGDNRDGYGVNHLRYKDHCRKLADMSAGLAALGDDRVNA